MVKNILITTISNDRTVMILCYMNQILKEVKKKKSWRKGKDIYIYHYDLDTLFIICHNSSFFIRGVHPPNSPYESNLMQKFMYKYHFSKWSLLYITKSNYKFEQINMQHFYLLTIQND